MREDVYRVAYDEANSELSEIRGKFEQLRLRKERLEKFLEAMRPIVSGDFQAPEAIPSPSPAITEPLPVPVQAQGMETALPESEAPSYSFQAVVPAPKRDLVPFASEPSSDPFQRRIDGALRQSVAPVESKEHTRHNGFLSRR